MTNTPPLYALLPHDMPMVLVDDLVGVGDEHIHCRVTISEQCLFFKPETRAIPGYVGIEFMAQSVAGWSGYHAWRAGKEASIGFLLGCRLYQTTVSQFPEHSVLDIYAERLMENDGMAIFSCRIECEEQEIATCQLNVFVPSVEKLDSMLGKAQSERDES
ncbi:hotdog family protein [Photobacterium makurazakiensis]|uniref:hotdog family protein n=1 Tax=Photobacterium makurazakiensis TaxID=2910234 RepID=UPI003D0B36B1